MQFNNENQISSAHWNGVAYSNISLPQYNVNLAFLSEQSFQGDETILDIGCGDGNTTKVLAARVLRGKVLGIDASLSMIEAATKAKCPENLSFQLLNAQQLNFQHQFNIITCFFCMQWVPDKLTLFRNIFCSLKSKGRFLMIVPLPHPYLPEIRQILITLPRWEKYFKNYNDPLIYINDKHYQKYAEDAGLKVTSYSEILTPVKFSSYEKFFNFMSQMTPHISSLPSQCEKDEFMNELVKRYLDYYPMLSDGSCILNFNLVYFCAYKSDAGSSLKD